MQTYDDRYDETAVRRNEYNKSWPLSTTEIPTEYQRNRKIKCCVLLDVERNKYIRKLQ